LPATKPSARPRRSPSAPLRPDRASTSHSNVAWPLQGLRRRLAPLRLRLKHLLRRHINSPIPAASKIAKDLREYGAALWTFARVEGVEPTNNAAERAVRKAVLWRKTSFGSASNW